MNVFSVLKRVKTYLRQTCGDDRLSDLMINNVESDFASKIDVEHLIDDFAKMKPRRYPLI